MPLTGIRNAVEMTTQPELSQLLALFIEHAGLNISAAALLLDLPPFMVMRFANHLVRLGYAARAEGNDGRYFATIAGREINSVMRRGCLR
jgi:DNA-binding IclR family transcriptional regulator